MKTLRVKVFARFVKVGETQTRTLRGPGFPIGGLVSTETTQFLVAEFETCVVPRWGDKLRIQLPQGVEPAYAERARLLQFVRDVVWNLNGENDCDVEVHVQVNNPRKTDFPD